MSTVSATSSVGRNWASLAVAWGWLLLGVGLAAANVTLASGDYRGVLLMAISCAGIAAVLLGFGIWRVGGNTRILAALGVVPLLFIISEFLRRY